MELKSPIFIKSDEKTLLSCTKDVSADDSNVNAYVDAILVNPCEYPREIRTGTNFTDFQDLLGKELEIIPHPFDDYAVIVMPTLELADDLEPNRAFRWPGGDIIVVINGSFMVVGCTKDGVYCSLTAKQKRRYLSEYEDPEAFEISDDGKYLTVYPLSTNRIRNDD